jgi:hypothetical protein
MVTNNATGGSAESTVTGKMTSNTAYNGALDTPFGISRSGDCEK